VFPNADIARVDRDRPASPSSTASIIVGSERFLSAVAPTFGRTVGCVAILHAERFARSDTYRAQERLLGALRSGAVFARSWGAPYIVQTSDPTSPAIRALAGDLSSFYREEIRERDALGYPPATRLLRLDARSDASDAESLRAWTATLPRGTVQAVDGPYEHPEQRGRVRRSILLRLDPNISDDTIADVVQNAMEAWTVDLDPVEL